MLQKRFQAESMTIYMYIQYSIMYSVQLTTHSMVPVSLHPPRFCSLYSLYCKWGGVVVGLATKMGLMVQQLRWMMQCTVTQNLALFLKQARNPRKSMSYPVPYPSIRNTPPVGGNISWSSTLTPSLAVPKSGVTLRTYTCSYGVFIQKVYVEVKS